MPKPKQGNDLQLELDRIRAESPANDLTAKQINYRVAAQDRINNPHWWLAQNKARPEMIQRRRMTRQAQGQILSDQDRSTIYWGQYDCESQQERHTYVNRMQKVMSLKRDVVRDCVINRYLHVDPDVHDRCQREWLDQYGEEYVLYPPSDQLLAVYDDQYVKSPLNRPHRKLPSRVWRVRQGELMDLVFADEKSHMSDQAWQYLRPRLRTAHEWIQDQPARVYRFSSGRSALQWLNQHTESRLDVANPQNKFDWEPRVMWKSRLGNHQGWILQRRLCRSPWLIDQCEVYDLRKGLDDDQCV